MSAVSPPGFGPRRFSFTFLCVASINVPGYAGEGFFIRRQWDRSVSDRGRGQRGYGDTVIVIVGLPDAAVRNRATESAPR